MTDGETIVDKAKLYAETLLKAAQNTISYARAEASVFIYNITPEEIAARLTSCKSCEKLTKDVSAPVGYCGACGCGKSPRAELSIKATMPAATCPLSRWVQISCKMSDAELDAVIVPKQVTVATTHISDKIPPTLDERREIQAASRAKILGTSL